jgi:hypothetical protein
MPETRQYTVGTHTVTLHGLDQAERAKQFSRWIVKEKRKAIADQIDTDGDKDQDAVRFRERCLAELALKVESLEFGFGRKGFLDALNSDDGRIHALRCCLEVDKGVDRDAVIEEAKTTDAINEISRGLVELSGFLIQRG